MTNENARQLIARADRELRNGNLNASQRAKLQTAVAGLRSVTDRLDTALERERELRHQVRTEQVRKLYSVESALPCPVEHERPEAWAARCFAR